eukprot:10353353-Lingulodinium_polyedra.AAC.1
MGSRRSSPRVSSYGSRVRQRGSRDACRVHSAQPAHSSRHVHEVGAAARAWMAAQRARPAATPRRSRWVSPRCKGRAGVIDTDWARGVPVGTGPLGPGGPRWPLSRARA